MPNIPIAGPWITQKEIDYVSEAVANGWYSRANEYPNQFETKMAAYIGRKYAISLPSCTSAIHLALLGLGIGPGDEVIVPEITWIASAAPLKYVGAKPIFADIDEKTWCISVDSIKKVMTDRVKAIIPVDLYGNMPAMDDLLALAAEHKIAIIEDAAQAVGSKFAGKNAGSFGDASVFSFKHNKTLTTGEGGILLTDRKDMYDRCCFLRDHGRATTGNKLFWNEEVAFNYRMSSIGAALGLAQLERVGELIQRRRDIFTWYHEKLADIPQLTLNYEAPNVFNTYWMATVILSPELGMTKEELIPRLQTKGVNCRPFFYPLSQLPAYAEFGSKELENPIAYKLSPYGVNLPSPLNLTREDAHFVCDNLIDVLGVK